MCDLCKAIDPEDKPSRGHPDQTEARHRRAAAHRDFVGSTASLPALWHRRRFPANRLQWHPRELIPMVKQGILDRRTGGE